MQKHTKVQVLTTIKNNIMLLAEYVSGQIFTHTATEVSTGKILVSFMGLGISVLLIVMALMVWVLRARPQKGKPPARKTAKKKAARKAARKAAKKKAAKKWPRLFGKKKPPKPMAKSESKPEAKPTPDAKTVMKDTAADTTEEVADSQEPAQHSQGEAAKDEAPESTPESTVGATPESNDEAADADSAATLAAIETEMIALKELYNTGHITAQVYVAESRVLYEKARQCAPPHHG